MSWVGHYNIVSKTSNAPNAAGFSRSEFEDTKVPRGSQYVLLTASESAETFLGYQSAVSVLEESAKEQFDRRQNYRQSVFTEEIRVNGPEGKSGDWTTAEPFSSSLPAGTA